jgi:hypothetical protein
MIPLAVMFVPLALYRAPISASARGLALAVVLIMEVAGCITFAAFRSTAMPLWAHSAVPTGSAADTYSFFERYNRINVRELPVIARLKEIVNLTSAERRGPITIMSGQMGMVAYHVSLAAAGRVRWLDRHGLSDRRLSDCPITAPLPRMPSGIDISYKFFFAHAMECGLATPDVIFDTASEELDVIAAHGFTLVYRQDGRVMSDSRMRGNTIPAFEFISVRNELVPALRGPLPTVVDFQAAN